jgi:hypothetical protein
MSSTRARRTVRSTFAIILAMLLAVVAGSFVATSASANANDQAGQCEGYDSASKIDAEDFVAGVATWYNVPGNDGKTYTVVGTLSADGQSITFQVYDGNTLVSNATVDFCLKGGSDNQEGPQYFEGVLTGGLVRDISNVVVYRVHVPVNVDQWCSPGFWRNSPIQAAAAAETADLSFLPEGVSYVDVLNNPQTYGGELFNKVGDALSAAAGLTWGDERPEDSCPFAADASMTPKPAPVAKGGKK